MQVFFVDHTAASRYDQVQMPNKAGLDVRFSLLAEDDFPIHTHDFNELVIILGGTGKHSLNEETYSLMAGDVFVLKGPDMHGLLNLKKLSLANISYTSAKLEALGMDIRNLPGYQALFTLEPFYRIKHTFKSHLRLSAGELAYVRNLLATMESEYQANLPAVESMTDTYFIQLVIFLSRRYTLSQNEHIVPVLDLANAINRIENGYGEAIKLTELSELSHLSVNQFIRIFKTIYGATPMQHLLRIRMRRACDLLKGTRLPVTEIAGMVGIPDSNYFTRIFKAQFGLSPREYRNIIPAKPMA